MEHTPLSAGLTAPTAWPYPPRRAWLAIVAIALGSFSLIVTELLPIALLSAMAKDLRVTEGMAGLLIALPAIIAAITALGIALVGGKADRRTLLVAFTILMLLSNLISLVATTFAVMLMARALIGLALGGFWSIAASLAPRLVRPAAVGSATAMILSGVSIGTLIAVPAGSFINSQSGWREAFLLTAALAATALLLQLVLVPRLPALASAGLRVLPRLLQRPQMRVLLGAVLLVFMGHLGAYTYIGPFLQSQQLGPALVTTVLLVYGVSGILGNFLAGTWAARSPRGTILGLLALLGLSVLSSLLLPATPWTAALTLAGWGLAFGGVPTSFQSWVFQVAHDAPETGSALLVAALQVAIGLGAATGGVFVDAAGPRAALWFGVALAVAGLVLVGGWGSGHAAQPASAERRAID